MWASLESFQPNGGKTLSMIRRLCSGTLAVGVTMNRASTMMEGTIIKFMESCCGGFFKSFHEKTLKLHHWQTSSSGRSVVKGCEKLSKLKHKLFCEWQSIFVLSARHPIMNPLYVLLSFIEQRVFVHRRWRMFCHPKQLKDVFTTSNA